MGLETNVSSIGDLNPLNPRNDEPASQGDNHIRLIKDALKKTFPNVDKPLTPSADELNRIKGLTSSGAQLNSAYREISRTRPVSTGGTGETSISAFRDKLFNENSLAFLDRDTKQQKREFLELEGRGLTGQEYIKNPDNAGINTFHYINAESVNKPFDLDEDFAVNTFGVSGRIFQVAYPVTEGQYRHQVFYRHKFGSKAWSGWVVNPWITDDLDRNEYDKAPAQGTVHYYFRTRTINNMNGQRWHNKFYDRQSQTIYTNNEDHPIHVAISWRHKDSSDVSTFEIGGAVVFESPADSGIHHVNFIVYPGERYMLKEARGRNLEITNWSERR